MYKCLDTKECVSTYKEYLKTKHWQGVKNRMYNSKIKYECNCCGKRKGLQLHHKSYNRVGNERLNDLIWLCGDCHEKVHEGNPKGAELWSKARKVRKSMNKKTKPTKHKKNKQYKKPVYQKKLEDLEKYKL